MKKIKLDGKEYDCPTKWDDITLKQQILVSNVAEERDTLKTIALLSGYCNIPMDVLKKVKLSEIKEAFKHLTFLSKENLPEDAITEFEFKGEKYNITESLMREQFQDWVSIETAFQNSGEKKWDALPYVIAVLAKKEGETLDDYDLEERAKLFKELPVSIANRLAVFFSLNERKSNLFFLLSLNKEKILEEKYNEVRNTIKQQVGGAWYTRLLNGMLLKYIKYLRKSWIKFYTS